MASGSAERDRWEGRPGQARALRILVALTPLLASLTLVAVVARLLGPAPGGAALVVRLVVLLVVAMVAAAVAERLARRLLPLSILLELSMLFPDRAPSRLSVAKRARAAAASPQGLLNSRDEDAAGAAVRILALMSALAAHDRRTRGHAERVRAFTDLLAVQMDLPRADRDKLRWAALLHDIGKLGVDAALLNKPSPLDTAEWEAIRRHPAEGARLAGPLMLWLGEWGKAIAEHHERFDGTGYPMGLAGAGISRAGRMVGVVDAYETMTAARAYKKAFATRDARAELARNAGSQFDPAVVRAFLAVSLPRMLWASGPLSFLVQLPFLRIISEAGLRMASVSGSVAATTTAVAGAAVISLPVITHAQGMTWTHRPVTSVNTAMDAAAPRTALPGLRRTQARPSGSPVEAKHRAPAAGKKSSPAKTGRPVAVPSPVAPAAAPRPPDPVDTTVRGGTATSLGAGPAHENTAAVEQPTPVEASASQAVAATAPAPAAATPTTGTISSPSPSPSPSPSALPLPLPSLVESLEPTVVATPTPTSPPRATPTTPGPAVPAVPSVSLPTDAASSAAAAVVSLVPVAPVAAAATAPAALVTVPVGKLLPGSN